MVAITILIISLNTRGKWKNTDSLYLKILTLNKFKRIIH